MNLTRSGIMDSRVRDAIFAAATSEPFCRLMGMRLVELDEGRSVVEMDYDPGRMDNIYGRAHGGAVFALMDEAFETASQTDGTIAVALNVSVTYVKSPEPGRLSCEAVRITKTNKTATYDMTVTDPKGGTVALCRGIVYQTGQAIPFIGE
jgi:acyl-CoA thioesterase